MVFVLKHTNNWHLIDQVHHIILDSSTQMLRRHMRYTRLETDKPSKVSSLSLDYDAQSRLIYYKDVGPVQTRWYKLSYGPDNNLNYYEDSQGNFWKQQWGVPFLNQREFFEMHLRLDNHMGSLNNHLRSWHNANNNIDFLQRLVPMNNHFGDCLKIL